MIKYKWYSIVSGDDPLLQGDFLDSCPFIMPTTELESLEFDTIAQEYNIVILSQSCDLIQKKINMVLVCPYWALNDIIQQYPNFNSKKWKNSLRKGFVQSYHLLNKCNLKGFEKDFLVVDFKNVFGVPYNFIIQFAKKSKKRVRLESPYKEHLSQEFARFIMRVGLPEDIPPF